MKGAWKRSWMHFGGRDSRRAKFARKDRSFSPNGTARMNNPTSCYSITSIVRHTVPGILRVRHFG